MSAVLNTFLTLYVPDAPIILEFGSQYTKVSSGNFTIVKLSPDDLEQLFSNVTPKKLMLYLNSQLSKEFENVLLKIIQNYHSNLYIELFGIRRTNFIDNIISLVNLSILEIVHNVPIFNVEIFAIMQLKLLNHSINTIFISLPQIILDMNNIKEDYFSECGLNVKITVLNGIVLIELKRE